MKNNFCIFSIAVLALAISSCATHLGPRPNIELMSKCELTAFREAVQNLFDSEKWISIAGDYGHPNWFFPPNSLKFLPWHRHFINRLEETLGVPLPFWDWTAGGIPKAFTEPTYVNSKGKEQANPLLRGPTWRGVATRRSQFGQWPIAQLRNTVDRALSQCEFDDFSTDIEVCV